MSWSAVGKSKQRLLPTLLKIGGKSTASRSTLLRIFMRGMGGSLSLMGSHFTWQAQRVARTRFRKIAKKRSKMHPGNIGMKGKRVAKRRNFVSPNEKAKSVV